MEELKRLDYLEFQSHDEIRVSERTVPYEDEDIDEKLTFPLKNSPIMKEIDEKIAKMMENEIVMDKLIDKDVAQKISNQRSDLIEEKRKSEEKSTQSEKPQE